MRINHRIIIRYCFLSVLIFSSVCAFGQLTVTVKPPKIAGRRAVVPLAMENTFAESIDSARATAFLLDDQGKVIAQATKWVIGRSQKDPGLAAGATSSFYFVVQSSKPFATTNVTAKITFTRLVLGGGKLVDVNKNVEIKP